MALKMLMRKRELEMRKKELEELRIRKQEIEKREADAETAINELTEEATDEEVAAVKEEVEAVVADKEKIEEDEKNLTDAIEEIESELKDGAEERKNEVTVEERKEAKKIMNRTKFFGLDYAERDAIMNDERVKNFVAEIRTAIAEKRAVTNIGLTIPDNVLPLITQMAEETSKLMKYVRVQNLRGTGRQIIMGDIPEGVWTEACGKLNELSIGFNDVEVDGYKVGGFFEICNASLEDNDVQLMAQIINACGRAIGKALDKAIVYGTGTKMPTGIVTRLAQTTAPTNYPATARTWVDLHATNVTKYAAATGKTLFKNIINAMALIDNKYSKSSLVWVMNQKTKTALLAESLEAITASAVVAGMGDTMPVVGGNIVVCDFMSDNDILFGYFDNYLLVQRAGVQIAASDEYKFVEDRTVVKATARYDGTPVIAESFALINIANVAATTTKTFASDTANS